MILLSKHMQSLQNFNEFAKRIDFLLYEPYSTVVSPYLFIDIIHIFHRKHEVFSMNLSSFTTGMFINQVL